MKRQQSMWWDNARNRHTIYSEKTIQRLRDAGILIWHEVGPWRGISGLVRKYPTAKPIVVYPEIEPVYDNSQADVIFGSEDFIPKLVEGMVADNNRLMDMEEIERQRRDDLQLFVQYCTDKLTEGVPLLPGETIVFYPKGKDKQ